MGTETINQLFTCSISLSFSLSNSPGRQAPILPQPICQDNAQASIAASITLIIPRHNNGGRMLKLSLPIMRKRYVDPHHRQTEPSPQCSEPLYAGLFRVRVCEPCAPWYIICLCSADKLIYCLRPHITYRNTGILAGYAKCDNLNIGNTPFVNLAVMAEYNFFDFLLFSAEFICEPYGIHQQIKGKHPISYRENFRIHLSLGTFLL